MQLAQNVRPSVIHAALGHDRIKALRNFDCKNYKDLYRLGVTFDEKGLRDCVAMDSLQPIQGGVTAPTISTPVQFLQTWLPGIVGIITSARKIDMLVGKNIVGSFEDEQIVQIVLEMTGAPQPYGDYTNLQLSSWNPDYEYRTVVRFEEGMRVGVLESARSSRVNISDDMWKREAAARALEIIRNYTGFYGYNSGNNKTYGFLNDPGLPSYLTVPNGVSGHPDWARKTFLEIQNDILTAIVTLQNQSLDTIDPEVLPLTLAVATGSVGYLSKTSDFGISVKKWLADTYPRIRVVSAPELNLANGGANVFYLYADRVDDGLSTDGSQVIQQNVCQQFRMLGVKQDVKFYEQGFANALAGIMVKRPYAVVRFSGI